MWLRLGAMLLAASATVAYAADSWTLKSGNDQRSVETAGSATVGDLHVKAFLSLSCNRTGTPVAWMDFTIADADQVTKVFDLSPFEGPDAPAQARALVTIEIVGDKAAHPLVAHQSGWYSAEHEGGFGFGAGGQSTESKALAALIKRMARAGTTLKVRVSSFGKPSRTIVSEFALAGSKDALTSLAKFCR